MRLLSIKDYKPVMIKNHAIQWKKTWKLIWKSNIKLWICRKDSFKQRKTNMKRSRMTQMTKVGLTWNINLTIRTLNPYRGKKVIKMKKMWSLKMWISLKQLLKLNRKQWRMTRMKLSWLWDKRIRQWDVVQRKNYLGGYHSLEDLVKMIDLWNKKQWDYWWKCDILQIQNYKIINRIEIEITMISTSEHAFSILKT